MKVYVSSTYEDLQSHRTAVVQILRQLGHEVVSMEDYVAENAVPLANVTEDVKGCDVLVEIVAWRYGYIPQKPAAKQPVPPIPDTTLERPPSRSLSTARR